MNATADADAGGAVAARACSRWDCSTEAAGPQPGAGSAPAPAGAGPARREAAAGACSRWDCLPVPATPTEDLAAPTLEPVA
ncbi:hypothetical protein ACFV1L_17710 [Kitasatospora sp. NPDC059646]|uniref:hypothetical protein n=1 Tax=Kitasatospora sp. NPDC059646 TaxID=3346893 RepID=UPI0036AE0D92